MKRLTLIVCMGLLAATAWAGDITYFYDFSDVGNWFSSADKTAGVNSLDWSAGSWQAVPPAAANPDETYGYYTDGIVPAGEMETWWASPGDWQRLDGGPDGAGDTYAGMVSANDGAKILQGFDIPTITVVTPNGVPIIVWPNEPSYLQTSLYLSFDYRTPGDSTLALSAYAMSLDNPGREPFFAGDHDAGGQSLEGVTLAGPDVAHTWPGGTNTGDLLWQQTFSEADEWTDFGASPGVPSDGAIIPLAAVLLEGESIVVEFSATGGSAAAPVGLDNVLAYVGYTTPGAWNEGDGILDLTDLGILATNWGRTDIIHGPDEGDFSFDGNVDLTDLGILATWWGAGTQTVPEPATLSLLALGGAAILRRQR